MADLEGTHTLDIDAPIRRVFAIAADVARAPEWQGTMKTADVLEEDADGRPLRVHTNLDSSVARHTMTLRFSYDEPGGMRWERESGDLKSLVGWWAFQDLGGERTRATYGLEIGLGTRLGLLVKTVRGPVRTKVEHLLTHQPVEGLKARAEG